MGLDLISCEEEVEKRPQRDSDLSQVGNFFIFAAIILLLISPSFWFVEKFLDDVSKQLLCYYTPKRTLWFSLHEALIKTGWISKIWWTRKWYMNLATNLRTTIAFGKTIKCNFGKCNFEYWNIIKGSSQGWFLWLVCLTDLIDTPHGFYSTRVTGTFRTEL